MAILNRVSRQDVAQAFRPADAALKRCATYFKLPGVVAVILLLAIPGSAQQPTFRSGARLTIVDVTVTGKDGRPVF